jgi:hypothetical protein
MKAIFLRAKSPWRAGSRITPFHCAVFHGLIQRAGFTPVETSIKAPFPSPFNGYRIELEIIRSGRIFPDIVLPVGTLLVTERVKAKWETIAHIELLETRTIKLVDLPMPNIGDLSWNDRMFPIVDSTHPHCAFYADEDEPGLHRAAPAYWEVLLPTTAMLADNYRTAEERIVSFSSDDSDDEPVSVLLSKVMLQEWPIVWWDVPIVRDDVLDLVAPYCDWNFFETTSVTL